MNIAQLKSKILDLAVRGKLTEQRPEEGSAEELLERIREEKQRLIAEGKLKKEKPLPEITEDEIPFNIPAGWKWVRLGEICDYGKCENANPSQLQPDSWILDLEDIEKGTARILRFYTFSQRNSQSTKHIFKKGDVLYSKLRPYLNKVVIAPQDGFCTSEILPLDFQGAYYNSFAQKLLMSPYFLSTVNMLTYGVKMPRLGKDDAVQILLPLPPLAEQKRIVEKIEAIFKQADIIEENRLALKTAVRHTKSRVLDLAVRGKLTEQNEHDRSVDLSVIKQKKMDLYFEIPDNWSFAHLESITKKISSKPYQILESQVLSSGKFPVISQAKEYSIGFSNDEKKVLFHDHPLVIFGDHTTEVKFVKTNFIVGADGVKIFEPTRSIISAEFLFYVLQFYSINLNKNSGYTRHYKYIKNKGIPLPPLAEQKRIVEKIEQIFGTIDTIEKAVEG